MKSPKFNYTFLFEPIQNKNTQVTQINHLENNRHDNFTISINDSSLSVNGFSTVSSISADLLDLAVAIHAVDRLIDRPTEQPLSFCIKLPVRNFDVFTKSDIGDLLTKVLNWYTSDLWCFEFLKREISGRNVEIQQRLPLEDLFPKNTEVALWSGGLDSLAGLYTRLSTNPESHHILIGTGSNSQVHKKQNKLACEVNRLFPGRTSLIQIPYSWSDTPSPEKNFGQRSRGLVFMLIGAACAHYVGRNSLFIYENGIGAINLPYSKSQVGLDQAKSVHPLSLLHVSKLVSAILAAPFQIIDPYWLWTKAQMVESLNNTDGIKLISLSSSCDRVHRLVEDGIIQCGICTSCLLRRQSIIAVGIDDPTTYHNQYIPENGDHMRFMMHQINTIRRLLNQDNRWRSLSKEYQDLDGIVDYLSTSDPQKKIDLREQIIQLYSKYEDEWRLFEVYIEKDASNDVITDEITCALS